ncbi:hypothetical protein ACFLX9_00920 [Chloroflexota bacterium]
MDEGHSWPGHAMTRRVSFWGATITGFLGIILTVNAVLSEEYVGAGVLLIASALSFGIVQHLGRHPRHPKHPD